MSVHNLAMATKVAIVGVTGYAGGERAPLRDALPHLHDAPDSLRIGADVGDAEVVFTALPAGEAAKLAPQWLEDGRRIVDIGSDFRLKDPLLYAKWYGYAHPAPEL